MNTLAYKISQPPPALSPFVESYWMLVNLTDQPQEMIILPDGRVDVFFSMATNEPYHVMLMGLEENADRVMFPAGMRIFAVSFKLPAVEYILQTDIAAYLNTACWLPDDFWGISAEDLNDFDHFCSKVSASIQQALVTDTDTRKLQLFDLIYSSNGAIPVKELSAKVFWSSRQINRYFNQKFGLSLKAYCNILRFRASFQHIKEGRLFPEEAFADQSHFIKNVKKYAGVAPKELHKNKNDLFIQFLALPKK